MSFTISESPVGEWLDNPIFMKHVRSRLRPVSLISWILIVVLLCGSVAAFSFTYGGFRSGFAIVSLLVFQGIILGIMGAAQVAGAAGGARSTGIMEFHRISPLTSAELTFGYLFGAPIREYAMFAVTLPFLGLCAYMGVPTPRGAIQLIILIVGSALLLHAVALASSLLSKRATAAKNATGLIVLLCVLCFPGTLALMQFLRQLDVDARIPFFGFEMPWLGFVLMSEAALFLFVILACLRRVRSDHRHPLSKPQGMACVAAVAVLLMGAFWNQVEVNVGCIMLLYALVATSIVMLLAVTPNRTEYIKGLLRARKDGRNRPAWWYDLAWNRGFLAVVCCIVFVSATTFWRSTYSPPNWSMEQFVSTPLAIANAVLIVAYTGLGHQYFLLRFGSIGAKFAGAFFFVVWGLPMLSGAIIAAGAANGDEAGRFFLALSPITGITFSAGRMPDPRIHQTQFASICPTLLFTFVFGALAVSARRRIDRAVRRSFEQSPEFGTAADQLLRKMAGS